MLEQQRKWRGSAREIRIKKKGAKTMTIDESAPRGAYKIDERSSLIDCISTGQGQATKRDRRGARKPDRDLCRNNTRKGRQRRDDPSLRRSKREVYRKESWETWQKTEEDLGEAKHG